MTRAILILLIVLFHLSVFGQRKSERPNIVFFLADDCTKYDLGAYGSKDAITPTIDWLADNGMKFNKAYQSAPMCSPTRHTIMTGMYPVRTGAYPNHTYVREDVKSTVDYLKPLGYRVALSGKRHIMPKEVFDYEYLDGSEKRELNPDFDKIDAFLKDAKTNKDNFCLYVCSTEPHSPWNRGDTTLFDKEKITLPPHIADTKSTRKSFRNYLAEINYMDGQVKRMLELLKINDLDENTLFVFSSEQGNSFPFAKWTCYNAGLTTGMIAYWPGKIEKGLQSDAQVEYIDLLPTFIELAGGERPEYMDGKSMVSLLMGNPDPDFRNYNYGIQTSRGIFSGPEYYGIRSVSDGTYRLIYNLSPEIPFKNTVTERDNYFSEWVKSENIHYQDLAFRYQHRPKIELYNDISDPYNLHDLAKDPVYKRKIEELKGKLLEWMAYCGDKGLETELRSLKHMRFNIDDTDMIVEMEHYPSQAKGNITISKKGYYTFYVEGKADLYVDGVLITKGEEKKLQFGRYGVIGLTPGRHQVDLKEESGNLKLFWSGPDFDRTALKL
ncbi:sulfatase [Echinicola marina]|uniref:sulfatase family protein n=1 Tax=Echinicola marina TaxID=2859768 RepID=UPI001CF6908C|nr:sulfatase [Echinicola marina]UCS91708.1 sulfatase [Echinicola marina]